MALDPRIIHCTTQLNGITYHYLLGLPKGQDYRATIFLIHGWPDISYGWRNQIPMLLDLGLRVVVPDMMGYGGTDAPQAPPEPMALYGQKRAADDMAELARQLGAPKIILGGHDWGGSIVYRIALWHPNLVTHIFSVCTPYFPPNKSFISLEDMIVRLPNLTYQKQLAGSSVQEHIKTKAQIREFLNALYGGQGPNREVGFDVSEGVLFDNLPILAKTPLLSEEELDYYAEQYAKHGIGGTLTWYRTREQNFKDETALTNRTITVPVLFILATKDAALTPAMSQNMQQNVPNLTRKEVVAGHWALVQAAQQVNTYLQEWFGSVVFEGKSVL